MATYRGRWVSSHLKIGIIVSRFNEFITKRLLESALETLERAGISRESVEVVWVPGALEIPYFCQKLAEKEFDVLIALACVIRGETYHFECVAHEVTRGISQVALKKGIPISTGILTVNHLQEAIDRAGLKSGNKGAHAALAALEIADLNRRLSLKKKTKRKKTTRGMIHA